MKLDAAIPTSPLVFADGNIRPEWRAFFNSLWIRTGGSLGQSSDGWQVPLAAEAAVRQQQDIALGNALTQETVARQTADTNEARTRDAADRYLTYSLEQETQARQTADAALVPKAQLCTLWAACDLTFLPTSDPGHGMPWLNGAVVTVGAATVGYITMEDGSGNWTLETTGTAADWNWG